MSNSLRTVHIGFTLHGIANSVLKLYSEALQIFSCSWVAFEITPSDHQMILGEVRVVLFFIWVQ